MYGRRREISLVDYFGDFHIFTPDFNEFTYHFVYLNFILCLFESKIRENDIIS